MNSDNINPMTELERLFEDRRRYVNNRTNLEADIKNLHSQLTQKELHLIDCNSNLANIENTIREWSKKL